MKPHIGELLWEQVASFIAQRELSVQLQIESFLGFLDREIDKAVEQLAAHTSRNERLLRQFEDILLRYADCQPWRNFLKSLSKRGKLDSVLGKFLDWLTPEKENPAEPCLHDAAEILREFYYGEKANGARKNSSPPLEKENWEEMAEELTERLRPVVLRELLLRTVRKVLDKPRRERLTGPMAEQRGTVE